MAFGTVDRETRDCDLLAPSRFSLVLDLEGRHGRPGRPCVPNETRELIRRLSQDNVGWGAPRIHSELLKLGIQISESSVSKYMVRHPKPPSQSWRTFLKNHATQLVSVDFFTVVLRQYSILWRSRNSLVSNSSALVSMAQSADFLNLSDPPSLQILHFDGILEHP